MADLAHQLENAWWAKLGRLIALLVQIAAFLIALGLCFLGSIDSSWGWLFGAFGASTALFAATLMHELGHALIGQAVGKRIWLFNVSNVTLQFRPKFRVMLYRQWGRDVGGFVLPTPKTAAADTVLRAQLCGAAGPAFSLLTALVLFLISYYWPPPQHAGWSYGHRPFSDQAHAWLNAVGVLAFAQAVVSGLPFTHKGRGNDAVQVLLQPLFNRHSEALRAAAYAAGLKQYGIPEAAWDPWLREHAAEARAKTEAIAQAIEALKRGDAIAARDVIVAPEANTDAQILLAYCAARHDGDPAGAADILARNKSGGGELVAPFRELAMIEILIWEHQREIALRRLDAFATAYSADPFWQEEAARLRRLHFAPSLPEV